ncbi:DUF3703 domain-containing protein [Rheinheimera soli]|uniref:DUF3703 domain-containing protein n=1 Tax=Rheinheimera soli TaxID=443616 RepID=A0ABU1W369_9GAMM|nr:DUF3703 domain-containing protein [Rheinheimera soli]MDR7122183.1 hypothetical protein [Rheinheimera soli]
MFSATEQAYSLEIKQAQQARRQQLWPQAWSHLERAHILGQQNFVLHLQSHWLMLKLAADQTNWPEIRGQLLRLLLTPLGHLTGRLPLGNPGSSRYPVLQPVPVPEDLKLLLSGTKDPLQ